MKRWTGETSMVKTATVVPAAVRTFPLWGRGRMQRKLHLGEGASRLLAVVATLLFLTVTSTANAAPEGAQIVDGEITIFQNENLTTINQTTQRGAINWHTFNVGSNESVHFEQPNAQSITLNRITGGQGASQILGSITSTGNVWLLNPEGVHFGKDAFVDVAGVLASTYDMDPQQFMQGDYRFKSFEGNHHGRILNEGEILVSGLAALISHDIENIGLIAARLGTVVLGSNPTWTLDFFGDETIHFTVSKELLGKQASVNMSGDIVANGGHVLLTTEQADSAISNVINVSGVVEANSVDLRHGVIVLEGGEKSDVALAGSLVAEGGTVHVLGETIELQDDALINVSGDYAGEILIGGDYQGSGAYQRALNTHVSSNSSLLANSRLGDGGKIIVWADGHTSFHGEANANALGLVGDGGFIETSGKQTLNFSGARVSASSVSGLSGLWLLDPTEITIDEAQVSGLNTTLLTTDVTFQTSSADGDVIFTNTSDITWTTDSAFTVNAHGNIDFQAAGGLNASHADAAITLRSDYDGDGNGTVLFSSTGGVTATNGAAYLYYNPTSLGEADPYTSDVTASVANSYQLVHNITELQVLDGDATVRSGDYALSQDIDASETTGWNSGAGFDPIGSSAVDFTGNFDGQNYTINDLWISRTSTSQLGLFATLSGAQVKNLGIVGGTIHGDVMVGALAGETTNSSHIYNVYSTAEVIGDTSVGGLIGEHKTPSVLEYVYATGNVTATGGSAGGLLGFSHGYVYNSYATGDVTAVSRAGGLIAFSADPGELGSNGPTQDVYALGDVVGGTDVGGLIGRYQGSTLTNAYSAGTVSGSSNNLGGVAGVIDGAIIENVYTTATVTGTTGTIGGFAGRLQGSNALTNVYSTGSVTFNTDFDLGGGMFGVVNTDATITNAYTAEDSFIGTNYATPGSISGAYFQAVSACTDCGVRNGANDATNIDGLVANDMKVEASFAGFNFTGGTPDWSMVVGDGFITPRLTFENLMGFAGNVALTGADIKLAQNGSVIDTFTTTSDENYYFLFDIDDAALSAGDDMLVYVDSSTSGGVVANYVFETDGATSHGDLDLKADHVTAGVDGGSDVTVALLDNAHVSDPDVLFSVSASIVTVSANKHFESHGVINAAGDIEIVTSGTGTIDVGGIEGAGNVELTSADQVAFSTDIGATDKLASLVVTGATEIFFDQALTIAANDSTGLIDFGNISMTAADSFDVHLNANNVIANGSFSVFTLFISRVDPAPGLSCESSE